MGVLGGPIGSLVVPRGPGVSRWDHKGSKGANGGVKGPKRIQVEFKRVQGGLRDCLKFEVGQWVSLESREWSFIIPGDPSGF